MFRKLNARLENLFDQNSQSTRIADDVPKARAQQFQTESEVHGLENLSYIFSNEINHDNLPNLFSQLSSYFELGFLLKLDPHSQKYHLKDVFGFSKKMIFPENSRAITLPKVEFYKILKTRARPFLQHFQMSHFDYDDKMFTYLIPISDNYTIVVATPVAEPWARIKIEALRNTLMKIHFSL